MIRWIKKKFNIKTDIWFVRIATVITHIGVIASFFLFDSWHDYALAMLMAIAVSVFMDLGYHRYYSHKAFKASKLFEIMTVIMTIPPGIGSPMAWAGLHRYHHKTSDTELDPHSPRNISAWQMFSLDYDYSRFEQTLFLTKDFVKHKWHIWLHRHYFDLVFATYLLTFLISPKLFMIVCAWPAVWNYITYMVTNYLEHIDFPLSERPYDSKDNSVNNIILNWCTLGHTGLHNNHHHAQGNWRYDTGGSWWEFDSGRWAIELFSMLGLIEKPKLTNRQ